MNTPDPDLTILTEFPPATPKFKTALEDATLEVVTEAWEKAFTSGQKTRFNRLRAELTRRYEESGMSAAPTWEDMQRQEVENNTRKMLNEQAMEKAASGHFPSIVYCNQHGLDFRKLSPLPSAGSGPVQASGKGTLTVLPGAREINGLADLDAMPSGPVRSLKDMSLLELEAADRGLRAMPERLESMSGISAVLNGLVLTEIKGRLEHKQWTPWLANNYKKSARTAQVKMKLAKVFSKSATVAFFGQLTLALLDDTQTNTLDIQHPVTKGVSAWTAGRSYRQLIDEEISDGRADNNPGFRPNALILRAWLEENYPENPEYLTTEIFSDLPEEVQKRFKAEGDRYEKRLSKERKAEIQHAADARSYNGKIAGAVNEGIDHGFFDLGTDEELEAIKTAFSDAVKRINELQGIRTGKKGKK